MARQLFKGAKSDVFAETLERELYLIKRRSTQHQFKSIMKRCDNDVNDIKYRVLCEYLLIKTRNTKLFTKFRAGLEVRLGDLSVVIGVFSLMS